MSCKQEALDLIAKGRHVEVVQTALTELAAITQLPRYSGGRMRCTPYTVVLHILLATVIFPELEASQSELTASLSRLEHAAITNQSEKLASEHIDEATVTKRLAGVRRTAAAFNRVLAGLISKGGDGAAGGIREEESEVRELFQYLHQVAQWQYSSISSATGGTKVLKRACKLLRDPQMQKTIWSHSGGAPLPHIQLLCATCRAACTNLFQMYVAHGATETRDAVKILDPDVILSNSPPEIDVDEASGAAQSCAAIADNEDVEITVREPSELAHDASRISSAPFKLETGFEACVVGALCRAPRNELEFGALGMIWREYRIRHDVSDDKSVKLSERLKLLSRVHVNEKDQIVRLAAGRTDASAGSDAAPSLKYSSVYLQVTDAFACVRESAGALLRRCHSLCRNFVGADDCDSAPAKSLAGDSRAPISTKRKLGTGTETVGKTIVDICSNESHRTHNRLPCDRDRPSSSRLDAGELDCIAPSAPSSFPLRTMLPLGADSRGYTPLLPVAASSYPNEPSTGVPSMAQVACDQIQHLRPRTAVSEPPLLPSDPGPLLPPPSAVPAEGSTSNSLGPLLKAPPFAPSRWGDPPDSKLNASAGWSLHRIASVTVPASESSAGGADEHTASAALVPAPPVVPSNVLQAPSGPPWNSATQYAVSGPPLSMARQVSATSAPGAPAAALKRSYDTSSSAVFLGANSADATQVAPLPANEVTPEPVDATALLQLLCQQQMQNLLPQPPSVLGPLTTSLSEASLQALSSMLGLLVPPQQPITAPVSASAAATSDVVMATRRAERTNCDGDAPLPSEDHRSSTTRGSDRNRSTQRQQFSEPRGDERSREDSVRYYRRPRDRPRSRSRSSSDRDRRYRRHERGIRYSNEQREWGGARRFHGRSNESEAAGYGRRQHVSDRDGSRVGFERGSRAARRAQSTGSHRNDESPQGAPSKASPAAGDAESAAFVLAAVDDAACGDQVLPSNSEAAGFDHPGEGCTRSRSRSPYIRERSRS